MSPPWSAEITNDPEQDYDLIVELLEDDLPRGRIHAASTGKSFLTVYPTAEKVVIDIGWIMEVVKQIRPD